MSQPQASQTDAAARAQTPQNPTGPGRLRRMAGWWGVLIPPLALAGVYAARALGSTGLIAKPVQEVAALMLLPAAVAVFAVRWYRTRDRLHLVLTAFSAALLCREIHFPGTHRGIYVAAAVIAVWCFLWRRSLIRRLWGTAKGRWLTIAAWSYALALLIQRRALRFLPDEADLHVQLEEVLENVSHFLLLVAALL